MSAAVQSIIELGSDGMVIDVECHITNGLPNMIIVGSSNKATIDAKERIRSGFSSAKLDLPRKRITLNLSPADVPKVGTG
ncbi:MAG: Mg chelatase, subunit ChlI, partial [Candidatus Saccharibacteria bacterium]|nr:Mg chelatase, subunit ChlI [Candidatus Saccharibacteria bacterium]